MPAAPAGLNRRATCAAGKYYDNGCQTCTAGYYCPGNDSKTQCQAGYYSSSGATSCSPCPRGTWTDQTGTQNSSGCKAVQGGYKANASSGATAQVACGVGYYSPGNTDTCTICPAGHYCNAQTTTTPTPCVPGRYAPTTGYGQDCEWCPAGYFNNVYGATSCCKCCSGWFNSQTSQTHCQNCPGLGSSKQGSPPASTSSNQCTFSLTDYVSSCDQPSSGACPPTQATATASSKARRTIRQLHQCPHHSQRRCPVPAVDAKRASHEMEEDIASYGIDTKLGSYECIDIETNLESCGGCVPHGETEGPDGGKDCTAIEHMSAVKCVSGKCTVGACRSGYAISADKNSCIPTSRHKHRGQGHSTHDMF